LFYENKISGEIRRIYSEVRIIYCDPAMQKRQAFSSAAFLVGGMIILIFEINKPFYIVIFIIFEDAVRVELCKSCIVAFV
jgi:hypothetical protein